MKDISSLLFQGEIEKVRNLTDKEFFDNFKEEEFFEIFLEKIKQPFSKEDAEKYVKIVYYLECKVVSIPKEILKNKMIKNLLCKDFEKIIQECKYPKNDILLILFLEGYRKNVPYKDQRDIIIKKNLKTLLKNNKISIINFFNFITIFEITEAERKNLQPEMDQISKANRWYMC